MTPCSSRYSLERSCFHIETVHFPLSVYFRADPHSWQVIDPPHFNGGSFGFGLWATMLPTWNQRNVRFPYPEHSTWTRFLLALSLMTSCPYFTASPTVSVHERVTAKKPATTNASMNANSNSPRTIAVENTREGWSMLGVLATRRAWPNFAAENPLDIAARLEVGFAVGGCENPTCRGTAWQNRRLRICLARRLGGQINFEGFLTPFPHSNHNSPRVVRFVLSNLHLSREHSLVGVFQVGLLMNELSS